MRWTRWNSGDILDNSSSDPTWFLVTSHQQHFFKGCDGHCADVVHGLAFTDALWRFPSAVAIFNTARPQAVGAARRSHVNRQLAQNLPGMGISMIFPTVSLLKHILLNYHISARAWSKAGEIWLRFPWTTLYTHTSQVSLAWCRSVSFSTGWITITPWRVEISKATLKILKYDLDDLELRCAWKHGGVAPGYSLTNPNNRPHNRPLMPKTATNKY